MKVVIPAGGPSKGLELITGRRGSRALLALLGGTLLSRHLDAVSDYADEIIVVSDDPRVELECREWGGRCRFVQQRGSGVEAAICSALANTYKGDELITILYSDLYYEKGFIDTHFNKLMSTYTQLVTVTRPILLRGTYLRMNVDPLTQQVTALDRGDYVNAGLYSLYADMLRQKLCNEGKTVHEAFEEARKRGLYANIWLGVWLDIDTPWDYLVASRFALSGLRGSYISEGASIGRGVVIEGPVYIEKGARIDHYSVLKGPVYVGANALVGAHSFVREMAAIYSSARIGAYAEVKRSVIYAGATIGSHSYIADSVVGASALVSPYTVTMVTPYRLREGEIIIMTTSPLEKLKVGSVIAAGTETRPHEVIPPATIRKD